LAPSHEREREREAGTCREPERRERDSGKRERGEREQRAKDLSFVHHSCPKETKKMRTAL
jgi:hypothetical protein